MHNLKLFKKGEQVKKKKILSLFLSALLCLQPLTVYADSDVEPIEVEETVDEELELEYNNVEISDDETITEEIEVVETENLEEIVTQEDNTIEETNDFEIIENEVLENTENIEINESVNENENTNLVEENSNSEITEIDKNELKIKAFIDFANNLPQEVTEDNVEYVGEQVNIALDMYEELIDLELDDRDDVKSCINIVYSLLQKINNINNDDITIYAQDKWANWDGNITFEEGIPTHYYYGPERNGGSVTKLVGEDGFYAFRAIDQKSCGYCGYNFGISHGKEYLICGFGYEDSDSVKVIGDEVNIADEAVIVGGVQAAAITFSGMEPGQSDLWVQFFVNYHTRWNFTRASCPSCGRTLTVSNDNNWYLYTDYFTVNVEARYKLNYDTNGGTSIDSQVNTKPNMICDFIITDAVPIRNGYTFLGWSDTQDGDVLYKPQLITSELEEGMNIITLEWEEGYGSVEKPVEKTLYAVWEEEEEGGELYSVIYKDGLDKSIFKDESHEELLEYASTPLYSQTPQREGYKFMGWKLISVNANKDGVQPTVLAEDANTNNQIIYEAQWEKENTTYVVKREYYVNNEKVATMETGKKDGIVGEQIDGNKLANDNPKWKSYTVDGEKIEFDYDSSKENILVLTEDVNKNVIILKYVHNTEPQIKDLSVTKISNNETPIVGEEFRYTITVSNPNSQEIIVTVEDELDEMLTFSKVSESDGGIYDISTHTVKWDDVIIPSNGYKQLLLWVKANESGAIPNEVKVYYKEKSVSDTVNIIAKEPEITFYTVVYTDGVNEFAFTSESYQTLSLNDITPPFSQTPQRKGYKFLGWKLVSVASNKNEIQPTIQDEDADDFNTIIYEAQWERIIESPKPSDSPKPSESPVVSEEPSVSPSVEPSDSPKPSDKPIVSEQPSKSPIVSENPSPSSSSKPSDSPKPTESTKPSETPTVSESLKPSNTPTVSEKPSSTSVVSKTPNSTPQPNVETTPTSSIVPSTVEIPSTEAPKTSIPKKETETTTIKDPDMPLSATPTKTADELDFWIVLSISTFGLLLFLYNRKKH